MMPTIRWLVTEAPLNPLGEITRLQYWHEFDRLDCNGASGEWRNVPVVKE